MEAPRAFQEICYSCDGEEMDYDGRETDYDGGEMDCDDREMDCDVLGTDHEDCNSCYS